MYKLGWILTWVWLVLLFGGWTAHFVVIIHDALTGNLKRRQDALENTPLSVAADHSEPPGRIEMDRKQ